MLDDDMTGAGVGDMESQFEALAEEKAAADELLAELEKDFSRIKAQKARPTGGVEGSTMEAICFKNDEHYVRFQNKTLSLEPRDSNKLYLVFNLIMPRFQKLLGRLSAFNAPFKARPDKQDPQALEEAEVVDHLIESLDEKVDEPSRMRERLDWVLTGGTAFELVSWVPNSNIELAPQFDESGELLYRSLADGNIVPESYMTAMVESQQAAPEAFEIYEEVEQVGEVGSEVFGPFNVFIDQGVRSVKDLAPDQWIHIATPKTVGWIMENFDIEVDAQSDINLVSSRIDSTGSTASGAIYLKDLLPVIQGSASEDDPKMALVVQSWQPSSKAHPKGQYVCWIPGDKILHADDNPYEEIPIVDFHFKPVTTNFWTQGYITPLISPQRFINKRMSQLGEQSNASIYSALLLGAGISPDDIPSDAPGMVRGGLNEDGTPNVARMAAPEIPAWFLESINIAIRLFNDAAGGADLMEDNKFPGQLRGPQAVPMLQEILDTQWAPLFTHLGERIARVKQMRLNRVKQFYPPLRTMHYTSRSQQDEVLTFHTEKILRSGTNYNITVERGSLLPELRALRESRIVERLRGPLAVLYMDERTGKLDKGKIAADLQFGDAARESRESKYRKLAMEINKMMWEGKQVPPVQPFYDHMSMLDEMEAEMSTTEFLKASPQIQQLFSQRWAQHAQFLQQEAQAQQQAMMGQHVQTAVAQATQQAAAMAAAQAVDSAMSQVGAQSQQPTGEYLARAQQATGGGRVGVGNQPGAKPKPAPGRSRKITVEERD
jgi:hypothetical protein